MKTTTIVQISDLHIREPGRLAYGRLDTAPYLERAVKALNSLDFTVDAVVITGDLVDFGRAQEYEHLKKLLQPLQVPYYLLAGNHDEVNQLRESFPEHTYLQQNPEGALYYTVKIGEVRLIALDTTIKDKHFGGLSEEQLNWLEKTLRQYAEETTIIAMHHPPFQTLIGHMDKISLAYGGNRLHDLVKDNAQVKRVICGHLHRAIDMGFAGAIASTTPSVAHQVVLDISPDAASCWNLEPPAYKIYVHQTNAEVLSYIAYVNDYEGPYPFHEGGKLID